jgi:hypothetical protein
MGYKIRFDAEISKDVWTGYEGDWAARTKNSPGITWVKKDSNFEQIFFVSNNFPTEPEFSDPHHTPCEFNQIDDRPLVDRRPESFDVDLWIRGQECVPLSQSDLDELRLDDKEFIEVPMTAGLGPNVTEDFRRDNKLRHEIDLIQPLIFLINNHMLPIFALKD